MQPTTPLSPDLLLRHEAFVLRLARSLVRDEASARDVAQETFLAALRHSPEPGILRGWLARVARHRASDLRRGESRRSEREQRAARPESQPPGQTAAERLELEHGLVSEVLKLDEPYRGVVVAVYYEGLAPAEVARRNGVAQGTVRAQLSRALEQLRGRLDAKHGDRATWGLALAGLLRTREAAAAAAGAGVGTLALPSGSMLAVVALAAGATLALGGWLLWRAPASSVPATASARVREQPDFAAERLSQRAVVELPAPLMVEAPAKIAEAPTASPALEELAQLLLQSRQIKAHVVERRLKIDPALRARYAWLEALPDAGLTRLSERSSTGFDCDLPWMRGGGAYFSFTERVHDYNRHPQVALQRMELRVGFYGGYEGAAVDLGEGVFPGLALDPGSIPVGLSEKQQAAWDLLHRPVEDYATTDGHSLASEMRKLGLDDDSDVVPGHTYLIRAVSHDEFDVLVAVEVPEAGKQDCTLAWRVLEQRSVPDPKPVREPSVNRDDFGRIPEELQGIDEGMLLTRLDGIRARGEHLLFADVSSDVQQRFAGLVGRSDAGLVRIVDRTSPFKELPRMREGGAYWSFARLSHNYDEHPDLSLEQGRFGVGFAGADTGVVVDLGELPLETAIQRPESHTGDAALALALREDVDYNKPRNELIADLRSLQGRVSDLRAGSCDAVVGHSYLVRSIVEGAHDLLAVFEVVELDERGVLIAWQLLRTWPVPSTWSPPVRR